MTQKRLFRSQFLVTSNSQHDVFEDAFLAVEGDKIIGLGPWKKRPRQKSYRENDFSFALITPPLFNLHAHLGMSLLKGLVEDVDLQIWLEDYIFPVEKEFLSPPFVRAGTELALCESIRNGVGFVSDMYFFPEEVRKAFEKAQIRGILAQSFFDRGGTDTSSLEQSFRIAKQISKKIEASSLLDFALAPHAPYTCSPQTLKETAYLAEDLKCGSTIHVAETQSELSDSKRQLGSTPLQAVQKSGLLDKSQFSLLAHMVWLEDRDFIILSQYPKATPILNPQCNAKLASGYPPVGKYINHKINFSLGTDGSASNNAVDIFSELNFLAKLQHLKEKDLKSLSRKQLFDSVTRLAAQAVGQSHIGSLEEGKKADFIAIDLMRPHLQPVYDPYSLLTYSTRGSDVHSMMINGKWVLKNRKILTFDESLVLKRARQWRAKLTRFFENHRGSKKHESLA